MQRVLWELGFTKISGFCQRSMHVLQRFREVALISRIWCKPQSMLSSNSNLDTSTKVGVISLLKTDNMYEKGDMSSKKNVFLREPPIPLYVEEASRIYGNQNCRNECPSLPNTRPSKCTSFMPSSFWSARTGSSCGSTS